MRRPGAATSVGRGCIAAVPRPDRRQRTLAPGLVRRPVVPAAEPEWDGAARRVLEHASGRLRVVGGPGTGKTTLLLARVAAGLRAGADPEHTLLLVGSRRAAVEMRERLTALAPGEGAVRTRREPLVRTVHSYAFGVLRLHAARNDEPPPRLLAGAEQDAVVRDLLAGELDTAEGSGWPERLRPAIGLPGFAAELRELLLRAAERGLGPDDLLELGARHHMPEWVAAGTFFRTYEQVILLRGAAGRGAPQATAPALDAAELVSAALDALASDPELLAAERARVRHLLVDDAHDLDPQQMELVRALGVTAGTVLLAGDPDQAVLSFRGADPSGLRAMDAETVVLGVDRRGAPAVRAACARLAARLPGAGPGRERVGPDAGPPAAGHPTARCRSACSGRRRRRPAGWPTSSVARTSRTGCPGRRWPSSRAPPSGPCPPCAGRCSPPGCRSRRRPTGCRWPASPRYCRCCWCCAARPGRGRSTPTRRRRCSRRRWVRPTRCGCAGCDGGCCGCTPPGRRRVRRRLLRAATSWTTPPPRPSGSAAIRCSWRRCGPRPAAVRTRWRRCPSTRPPRCAGSARCWRARVRPSAAGRRWSRCCGRSGRGARSRSGGGRPARAAVRSGPPPTVTSTRCWPCSTRPRATPTGCPAPTSPASPTTSPTSCCPATPSPRVPRRGRPWRCSPRTPRAGGSGEVVAVPGVQEGSWPDLRLRGSLLGSERLVDVVAGVGEPGADTVSRVAPLLAEERRLFYVACSRARHTLLVSAVQGEDEQPSRFLDELDPVPAGQAERPVHRPGRALVLAELVGELRRAVSAPVAASDDGRRRRAAAALARLAAAGVPGAHPDGWYGLAAPSTQAPLRPPGELIPVSPSDVERIVRCPLRWVLERHGGGEVGALAAVTGSLVHALVQAGAAGADGAELEGALQAAWTRLDAGAPWFGRRELARVRGMLGAFDDWVRTSRADGLRLVAVEQAVQVDMDGDGNGSAPLRLRGRVDRLEVDREGPPGRRRRQDRQDRRHGAPGRRAPAARGLPARRGARGVRRAARRGGAAGWCPAGLPRRPEGRGPGQGAGAAPARPRRAGAVAAGRARLRRRHVRGPVRGAHRAGLRPLRGAHELPRARLGARGHLGLTLHGGAAVRLRARSVLSARAATRARRTERARSGRTRAPEPSAASGRTRGVELTPHTLAAALGVAPPTEEQAAVIAAPARPALVVAGAGAGKTETMAARVVWLVATGQVLPEEVLGLTFTRKAAQQLGARVRSRLRRLAGSRLLDEVDPTGGRRAAVLAGEPTVSTYHAYAGRLVGEHALRLPAEPAARLLGETASWQLAHRVVTSWADDLDVDRVPATVTGYLLALAGELGEHLVAVDDVRRHAERLVALLEGAPRGKGQRAEPSQGYLKWIEAQRMRIALLPLVEAFAARKRAERAVDFGDQLAIAARVAAEHPEVGAAERATYRAVLLDEYQDTGHAQRVLLRALFGTPPGAAARSDGPAVTAVGDPCQSIYGWRGASAGNLVRFRTDFPAPGGAPADQYGLLTSFRNPPEVLALANAVSGPLRTGPGSVGVGELRAMPTAQAGDVRVALLPDVAAEVGWLADGVAEQWRRASDAGVAPPTSAVLVRRRADMDAIASALRARGLPVEVVGLGGLLDTPEVRDLVSALRLVADPLAGPAAVRLLTGARWRLGVADLAALWQRARSLVPALPSRSGPLTAAELALGALPGEHAEQAGLVDALDDPGPAGAYSAAGFERIRRLGRELGWLRARASAPLTDLVADAERVLLLDAETAARPGPVGRAHLDAFADVVAEFATGAQVPTLPALLDYLETAEKAEDGLRPGDVEVAQDRVQVLTVHAAKGLEWQVVAVPHLVSQVFPGRRIGGTWMTSPAELPVPLRGDAADLPAVTLPPGGDRKQLTDALAAHDAGMEERRLVEERRLFYVALTRAERVLLVSGHRWGASGDRPREPSGFLLEVADVVGADGVEQWAEAPEADATNPATADPVTAEWPVDPLGDRSADVHAGADLVHDALRELAEAAHARADAAEPGSQLALLDVEPAPSDPGADPEGWAADVDVLLAERAAAAARPTVALPPQLSVSQLVELAADPAALAARLRRPLPLPPNPHARRGTAFHAWLEQRFGAAQLLDLDELPGAADDGAGPDGGLAELQDAFLASAWADRRPVEVEVPFETVLGGIGVRGRMDAVFADPDGGWTVVDWKTGGPPDSTRLPALSVQLAAYRLAWAALVGCEPDRVRAAFHYVRDDLTLRPVDLLDADGLRELVASVPVAVLASPGPRRAARRAWSPCSSCARSRRPSTASRRWCRRAAP